MPASNTIGGVAKTRTALQRFKCDERTYVPTYGQGLNYMPLSTARRGRGGGEEMGIKIRMPLKAPPRLGGTMCQ